MRRNRDRTVLCVPCRNRLRPAVIFTTPFLPPLSPDRGNGEQPLLACDDELTSFRIIRRTNILPGRTLHLFGAWGVAGHTSHALVPRSK